MDLQILNERQKEAVLHEDGPLLVLAGAGCGKTRVLTHKIAYLIEEKRVFPSEILAITFTNKAAGEMKERINALVGDVTSAMWVGTFHSMCVRILRRDVETIGFKSDFVIYDTTDQKTVVKNCIKQLGMNDKQLTPKMVLARISDAKNDMMSPEQFENDYYSGLYHSDISKVYELYQRKLKQNNAMDFDDLILNTLKLLKTNSDVKEKYQNKFRYIFVDEYQDTNKAQYELVHILADKWKNICVVGDADQSIYGWRGADIRNIREFEKDFTGAEIIQLEQNYRSTQNILNAANQLIDHNPRRYKKNLWTDGVVGEKILYYMGRDEYDEARYNINEIERLIKEENYNSDDCAILYRTNAQSRVFESILQSSSIPYKIIGGHKFYDRKEIKDALSYLRLIQNTMDDVAFLRIVNEPKRGIGTKSIEKIAKIANENKLGLFDAVKQMIDDGGFSKKISASMSEFVDLITDLRKIKDEKKASDILVDVLRLSGYKRILEMEMSVEAQSRLENLEQLLQSIFEFESTINSDKFDDEIDKKSVGNLENYLAEISLVSDIDSLDDDDDGVRLMTLHAAKGLEFPAVFLVGMEEGIFPTSRAFDDPSSLEEERRLAYVGMTRAKRRLSVSHSYLRNQFGKTAVNPISRFIEEMPQELLESKGKEVATRKQSFDSFKKNIGYDFHLREDNKKTSTKSENVSAGSKVRHKVFGEGTVISVDNKGDKTILTIAFDEKGIKKLQFGLAPIEVM